MLYALHDYDPVMRKEGAFVVHVDGAQKLNKLGYGIFVTPNTFNKKRSESDLVRINYFFVDIDQGIKSKMFSDVTDFELIPSRVIETKKGIHVWFKCSEHITEKYGNIGIEKYKEILSRLCLRFNGDKNAKLVTQLLREPNFKHQKNPNDPFMIKEIFNSKHEYSLAQMNECLPMLQQEEKKILIENKFVAQESNTDFWNRVNSYPVSYGLNLLSGASELRGDRFEVICGQRKSEIRVNGILTKSCWIDSNGLIGSHSKGGPTLLNWVMWYGHSESEAANILQKYIPELSENNINLKNFGV